MGRRDLIFSPGEHYHVFNRGVASQRIFWDSSDYKRFIKTSVYYQTDEIKPRYSLFSPEKNKLKKDKLLVEVVAYALMPNHFHFLLKELKKNGISEFTRKTSNSYAKYFNTKYKREGPLFQGKFKAVHVESNEQLLHLSRYIHLNPLVGHVCNNLKDYKWSSYNEFVDNKNAVGTPMCSKNIILGQFKTTAEYEAFVLDQISYANELELIKHQLIDTPGV